MSDDRECWTVMRKQTAKPALADDEISEDLLDNIPELPDAKAGGFSGFARAQDKAVPFTVLADDEDEPPAVDTLVNAAPGFAPPGDAPRPVPYPLGGGDAPPITPTPFPLGGAPSPAPASSPAGPAPPVDAAVLDMDVHGLVDQARTLMENAFQQELGRVERAYAQFLTQMESQLKQAELELAAVQAEHARVKAENDKKADALRDLKKALENI